MNVSVTNIINTYHLFDKDFWLRYKVLEKIHPNFSEIKMTLLKSKKINDKYLKDIDINVYNKEIENLNNQWLEENERSKLIGVNTHDYIRNMFCTDLKNVKKEFEIDTDLYKLKLLEELKTCTQGIFVERKLELELEDDILIGIPDCFIIHDGIVDIIDWKTNDKISFKSRYELSKNKSKKLKYPLNTFDDCNGILYQLQLSIYMWMLLKLRPDLKPGYLKLVHLKDNKIKKIYQLEYLDDVIEKLIKWHLKNLKLKEKLKSCKEINYE